MKPNLRILSLWAVACLGLATAGAVPVTPAREPELTGTYEDAGIIVVAPPGDAPKMVSLHALLSRQFLPGLARILHEQTGEVRLKHTAGRLLAEVTNRDGEVAWEFNWRQGEGYGVRGERVLLHFKALREGEEEYLLVLETVTAYKLLQVEVQRLVPTILGPRAQPMGTFLFHRLD